MTALDYFERVRVVHIATRTRDGREILTPIYAVVVDGEVYIRNGTGEASGWVQRARRNGGVAFANRDVRYPVRLEPADPGTFDAVDAAYRRKYRFDPGLAQGLREPMRSNTLRVIIESGP